MQGYKDKKTNKGCNVRMDKVGYTLEQIGDEVVKFSCKGLVVTK
ncbi:hypothetical protein MNBD_CHLOROFLEXI01-978 [hydrothermal vent metagenome]|uniref:Uncharacterized protein n=1 Tax=hydrothermal vent metagenome TaxID=652676 RepID=A0A3B0VUN3_9ZZZZ